MSGGTLLRILGRNPDWRVIITNDVYIHIDGSKRNIGTGTSTYGFRVKYSEIIGKLTDILQVGVYAKERCV